MRNHLTKFKDIDFISHTYHNLITTLSQQPYHNFISSQQLQEHISTNSSQLHFNKLFTTSFQQTLQQIEWYIIHHKHSTNIFEKRSSKLFITNISTNSSQLHFNKLFNKLSDILFITNIQRIFLRNDLANYSSQTFQQTMIHFFINTSSQTFQQTMIHFYITNIHNRRVGYRTSSHLHHD